jgi:uncharacterized SAM-binding protein YcdF (DUF218 family)
MGERLEPLPELTSTIGREGEEYTVSFSLQVAVMVVNLMLFAGFIVLATAISRIPLVRSWRRPQRSGLVLSALIIVVLVYLYPLVRTRLLSADFSAAGPSVGDTVHRVG